MRLHFTFLEFVRVLVGIPALALYIWATYKVAHRDDLRDQTASMCWRTAAVVFMVFPACLAIVFDTFPTTWIWVAQTSYLFAILIIGGLALVYYLPRLRESSPGARAAHAREVFEGPEQKGDE